MIATGGGGSAGSATDIDAGTANNHPSDDRNSAGGAGGARLFIFNGIFFDGRGGMSLQPQFNNTYQGMTFPPYHDVGHGAGSGGLIFYTGNQYISMYAQTAGIFGGGGGTYVHSGYAGSGGDATLGGGGGGISSVTSNPGGSQQAMRSGRGGNGVVIIEYIERS